MIRKEKKVKVELCQIRGENKDITINAMHYLQLDVEPGEKSL